MVGLAGSPQHVLGYEGAETGQRREGSPSLFPYAYLQYVVEHEGAAHLPKTPEYEIRRLPRLVKGMGGVASQLNFVAKTISHTPHTSQHTRRQPDAEEFILLGSPLYVTFT